MEENLAAADLPLSADELREITTAADQISVQDTRYSEAQQQLAGR